MQAKPKFKFSGPLTDSAGHEPMETYRRNTGRFSKKKTHTHTSEMTVTNSIGDSCGRSPLTSSPRTICMREVDRAKRQKIVASLNSLRCRFVLCAFSSNFSPSISVIVKLFELLHINYFQVYRHMCTCTFGDALIFLSSSDFKKFIPEKGE